MSHNILKVSSNTSDRVGAIAVDTTDLSDVTGSPALNDLLVYDGAAWAPNSTPTSQATEVVAWLGGFVASFALGGAQLYPVGNMYFMGFSNPNVYRVDGYHDLSSAKWITFGGGTAWVGSGSINRLELVAGTYLFKFQHITYSGSANPYVDVQWQTVGGTKLGPIGRIGTAEQPCNVYGAAKFLTTTTIGLNIVAKSGGNYTPYGSTVPGQQFNQKLQATILRIA